MGGHRSVYSIQHNFSLLSFIHALPSSWTLGRLLWTGRVFACSPSDALLYILFPRPSQMSNTSFRDSTVVIIETGRTTIRAGQGLHDLLRLPTIVRPSSPCLLATLAKRTCIGSVCTRWTEAELGCTERG